MHEFDGVGGFKRELPKRFSAERDDRLMASIYEKYATEIKIDDEHTGHMFCNKEQAKALAQEIRDTHKEFDAFAGD